MKVIIKILEISFLIVSIILISSCKKEEVPTLSTSEVVNITGTTATSGGIINEEGSETVLVKGVCWSTEITPTLDDRKTIDGSGAGNFSSNLTDLNGGTTYYVRAYATNSAGTGYGMTMSFSTLGQLPSPTVTEATNIIATGAILNGSVNANYLTTVVTFEYGTTTNYGQIITPSQSPVNGNSITIVSVEITGLTIATIYHYRIKAVNSIGTNYSNDITFTTLGQVPTTTSQNASNISTLGATLNGIVNAHDLTTTVTFEYGTSTAYGDTAIASQNPITGNSNTNVSANITGLTAGALFHYRVKAVNSLGTTYGNDITFTTLGQVPTVSTLTATNITSTEATLNGLVNANDLSTTVSFEYGITNTYDGAVSTSQSPLTGHSNTAVSVTLTGLNPGTLYHFRIKSTNLLGTVFSNDLTFTTLGQIPSANTLEATNILTTTATLNGTVNPNYLTTTVTFEYGTSTSYGGTVTASQNPVIGSSSKIISAAITELTAGITYHYRVKAVNSLGTTYGSDVSFTFTVTDVEGNIYKTVTVGTQVWMAENLKTTKYRDGNFIANVTDNTTWGQLNTGAYCWYNNDAVNNKKTYGALYNWYTITDSRVLCPTDWHVPTDTEWSTLTNFLGGESIAGGKMKETGTIHWINPNISATNLSGFTGLPGGCRLFDGTYGAIGYYGYWWSSTELDTSNAWDRDLDRGDSKIRKITSPKVSGFSIRCIKDN